MEASDTRGRINARWRLRMTPDRVAFHAAHPDWQREQTEAMHENIGAGDLVYYCGAESGDYPALLATWGARVVCIEPQPRYWPSIRAHLRANVAQPVASFVGFACDETRPSWESALWREPEWPPCSSGPVEPDVGFLHVSADPDSPRARLDTLAEVLPAPSVICADVEGAELRVLQGAERILRERRPLCFISIHKDEEWMATQYPGEGAAELQRFMAGLGYVPRCLAESHEDHYVFENPDGKRLAP